MRKRTIGSPIKIYTSRFFGIIFIQLLWVFFIKIALWKLEIDITDKFHFPLWSKRFSILFRPRFHIQYFSQEVPKWMS